MAIDNIPYPEAHDLAHKDKAFYPVKIPVAHWQLRHFISNPEPDVLYFASGRDIYCLNTATNKRKHIATLPFDARCSASGFGYVCVGGEDCGHFAVIKVDGWNGAAQSSGGNGSGAGSMDVDSALPLDGWRSSSSSSSSNNDTPISGRRAATVKVERIGEEIVNSISIHRLSSPAHHLDDIVAILTNNDKTVRIYSLPLGIETTVLELPFPMNHATLSPDGRTMVAVGDVNLAYFFQREVQADVPLIPRPHNRITSAGVRWYLTSVVALHKSEAAQTQCYFTTAWNPSGTLVAVGSEGGYITVFDTAMLEDPDVLDEDAIVAVVPGSRPDIINPHPGAIRSMVFSPAPWDLLVWAEDQGRVCVGDLRTGLKSRQILRLEPKDESLRRVVYEDVAGEEAVGLRDVDELEADFMQRYRRGGNTATQNFADEYIEARRRQRQQRTEMASMRTQLQAQRELRELQAQLVAGEDDPRGLTAEEQRIFESLRSARQREEARGNGGRARGINYTSADLFREHRAAEQNGGENERPIGEMLSSVQDSLPELARTSASPGPRPTSSHGPNTPSSLPSLESISNSGGRGSASSTGQWASAARTNLVRLSDGSRLPRRRASVVLSPPVTNSPSPGSPLSNTDRASIAAAAAADAVDTYTNPWRTIEEHMSLARGPLFDATRSSRQQQQETPASTSTSNAATPNSRAVELQADLDAERARARALARQRERLRAGRTGSEAEAAAGSTLGPNVAVPGGLAQGNEILLRRAQAQAQQMQLQSQAERGGFGRYAERWEANLGTAAYRHWGERMGHVGVRTAGLAVSADGGRIWAACEEGIFEVGVRRGRGCFGRR